MRLSSMVSIIQPQANDFAGTKHRRQKRDLFAGIHNSPRAETVIACYKPFLDKRYCLLGGSERGFTSAEQTDHFRWNAQIRNCQFICFAHVTQRCLMRTIQIDNLPIELSSNT